MSRWTYRSDTVTVGPNSQKVRQLTAGERRTFADTSKAIKEGKAEARDLPYLIAGFGCIDPQLSKDELHDMPTDLLDACVDRIMKLTGFREDEDEDEKKALAASVLPTDPIPMDASQSP